jgi:hypothetical protein
MTDQIKDQKWVCNHIQNCPYRVDCDAAYPLPDPFKPFFCDSMGVKVIPKEYVNQ